MLSIFIFSVTRVKQAKFFEREGCDRIHIVDLDAAFGRREINKNTILKAEVSKRRLDEEYYIRIKSKNGSLLTVPCKI